MATRWTDIEESDLFDFVSANKDSSWKEVHSFMLSKNYGRTSEACRKRYKALLKESNAAVEIHTDNHYVEEITNNLVDVLPAMSESDWEHERPPVVSFEDQPYEPHQVYFPNKDYGIDPTSLDEVTPEQEYEKPSKYTQEQKKDIVSTLWAILFIIFCILLYNFIH